MHAKRFEELKATGLLPSPTGVGLEILRLTRGDASAREIATVIRVDPALAGRTLRLANTGNAASGRPVTNISDAVSRLGTRTVSAVALGFTILAGNRSGSCRGFDYQRYWSHSLASAIAAQLLCAQTRRLPESDGFTAGLLSQVGRLALASIHAEAYAAVLAEWQGGSPLELVRLEQRSFVTDHNELASVMLEDWGLSPTVCGAVLHQETPSTSDQAAESRELARILNAAARIADVCVAATEAQARALASDLLARCHDVGIGPDAVGSLFEHVFARWTAWGQVLEIPTQKPPRLDELIESARSAPASVPDSPASEPAAIPVTIPDPFVAQAQPPANVADDGQQGLLVLVADKDVASLRFLEKFLVLSGHRACCATGGHEALQIFFETAPQLVIVDAALPEIGGLEFCRRLRQTTVGRQAYVIMLTPPDDEETLLRLFEAGVDDFVTKPFSARPLFARIRSSLRVVALQKKVNDDRNEIQRFHSELAVARRRLEQDALTDVLTGLPNRRYLIDRLAHDWAAARRSGTPLACMMIDIDRFKMVNDTFGHDIGDQVLEIVARILQREVRGTDVVCRYGGEEFVVLTASDFESALRGAERLRSEIETQLSKDRGPTQQPLTVSIGVAVRNDQNRGPESMLKAADEAMFFAKRAGRNRVASVRDMGTTEGPRPRQEGDQVPSEPLADSRC